MADIEYIENTAIVETALDFLKSNKYKPFNTAYFVTLNDRDDCGEDFCLNCISNEVKRRRKEHKESRDDFYFGYNASLQQYLQFIVLKSAKLSL